MQCHRLKKLIKSWYLQVQDEALAPARMAFLMKQHIADCRICLQDPEVRQEVDKITEIILPPSKVRIPVGPKEEEIQVEEAEQEIFEEAGEREEEQGEEEELEESGSLEEELEEDEEF